MALSLLSQLAYYAPSVLAHLVGLAVAAALASRDRLAAGLLAAGIALQLLASCLSFGGYAGLTVMLDRGSDIATASTISSVTGLLASLVRAVGELGVVAAVWAAVAGKGAAAPEADPYGFPR